MPIARSSFPRKLDIPLKVLIVDPDQGSSTRLAQALRMHNSVISVEREGSLRSAREVVFNRDINAVYLDPISLKLEPASDFIDSVRAVKPEVVYVFYVRMSDIETADQGITIGGFPLRPYFKLDKDSPRATFERATGETIRACQSDLSFHLTEEKIDVLQEELRSLQRDAENDRISISPKTIREIQEQLSALSEAAARERKPYTTSFLGPEAEAVDPGRCFVLMPYSQTWSEAVETTLRSCCEEVGLEFEIAKQMGGAVILNDIWKGITGAGVIVADLTGANANVAYEVGLADSVNKQVILISQRQEVPVDFAGKRLIIYQNTVAGAHQLKKELIARLSKTKKLAEESDGA